MAYQTFSDELVDDRSGSRPDGQSSTRQGLNLLGIGLLLVEGFWIALGLDPLVLISGAALAGCGVGCLIFANMPGYLPPN